MASKESLGPVLEIVFVASIPGGKKGHLKDRSQGVKIKSSLQTAGSNKLAVSLFIESVCVPKISESQVRHSRKYLTPSRGDVLRVADQKMSFAVAKVCGFCFIHSSFTRLSYAQFSDE